MNIFHFDGLNGCDSKCGVEVIAKGQGHAVVICTELSDNPGTSVTNAWPQLADDVENEYNLCNYDEIVWIEHYPERGCMFKLPEVFERVFISKRVRGYKMDQTQHPWKRLTSEQVEELIP